MEITGTWIKLSELTNAAYNPPHRILDVADLVTAIRQTGYVTPIVVTKDGVIVEGHRRVAACRELGMEGIPAHVVDASEAEKLYAALNAAIKKHTGADHLHVYLRSPDALSLSARRGMSKMEQAIGREVMEVLADRGGSMATYRQAVQVARYCNVEDETEWLKSIVLWLIKNRQTYQVRKAMEEGILPSAMLESIERGAPLRRTWN